MFSLEVFERLFRRWRNPPERRPFSLTKLFVQTNTMKKTGILKFFQKYKEKYCASSYNK